MHASRLAASQKRMLRGYGDESDISLKPCLQPLGQPEVAVFYFVPVHGDISRRHDYPGDSCEPVLANCQ